MTLKKRNLSTILIGAWVTLCFVLSWSLGVHEVVASLSPPALTSSNPSDPVAFMVEPGVAEGSAKMNFSKVKVAKIGSYSLNFTVGDGGIAVNGGISVNFPKSWFTNPYPIYKIVQQVDPAKPHYVSAACSRPGTGLVVEISQKNFWGEKERFTHVMNIRIQGSPLIKGDTIKVTLANTTAPYLAGKDEVMVAVDSAGDGHCKLIASGAPYEILSGAPVEITLTAPSQAVTGQPVELQVTAFDRFYNPAQVVKDSITFSGLDSPPTFIQSLSGQGRFIFSFVPQQKGFVWPQASARLRPILLNGKPGIATTLSTQGNPVRVFDTQPPCSIFWGELHSHTSVSKDGTARNDFHYARDISRLDFYASTEHSEDDAKSEGITPSEWAQIVGQVNDYYQPGSFATLLAYECTMTTPSGHHNVFFRSLDADPISSWEIGNDVERLWAALTPGDAITIPHHTGILWGGQPDTIPTKPGLQPIPPGSPDQTGGPVVSWWLNDPSLRPLVEIYSLHGSSEFYAPSDPLSYESVRFSSAISKKGPHYARDAWKAGLRLGVIAGSDSHHSQPGSGGLAAVISPALDREAIFDALSAKRTYGTTGPRIYLEFNMGGMQMGESGNRSGVIQGSLLIAAPRDIASAKVIRLNLHSGEYTSFKRWANKGKLLRVTFSDVVSSDPLMYYARVELTGKTRGRVTRAWSSPIWIDPD